MILFLAALFSFGAVVSVGLFFLAEMTRREESGHVWRPAVTSHGPARHCICGITEQLTIEEFYAQFGTMPNCGIIAK